ncbi:hypothetical protein B0H14DRAFT_2557476 [Mycena olivaceomarginata]|nr:hypothetical protein B0H14DRAFT_2557476 [Mycena olivaceomarginata]
MLPVKLAGCCQLPSVGAMGAPIESSQTWDLPPIFGWEHPTFQLNILGAPSNSSNGWEHPAIFGGSTGSSHNVMEASRWQIGSSQNIFSIEFIRIKNVHEVDFKVCWQDRATKVICLVLLLLWVKEVHSNSVGDGSQLYWYLIGQNEPQDAKVSSDRQRFTIHVTPPNDLNLQPLLHPCPASLPKRKGKGMKPTTNAAASQPRFYCSTCPTSADVEEEEDDNDVGGTKITSFNPFPKPIGSNWFQHIMGPMGVKFGRSSHIQREGPQQLREVCGLSHIANLGFRLLMWEFPEGHITGTKQIAILHAFLHILGCK